MGAGLKPRKNPERGSVMVEMALILPVYFMLVFGMISLCFVMFGYCNATYASRQASRYAATHGSGSVTPCSSTDLQNIVKTYLWGAPSGGVTITPTWSPDNNPGSTVSVNVTLQYTTPIPFTNLRVITIGTTAVATILQ